MRALRLSLLVPSIVLAATAACSSSPGEATRSDGQKILNGTPSTKDDSIVEITGTAPNGQPFFCTGTLLRNDLVLTAAHCIMKPETSDLTIWAGMHDPLGALESAKATFYIRHPTRDVAVIRLDHSLPVGGPNATTGYVAPLNDDPPSTLLGKTLTCYGVGSSDGTQNTIGVLRSARLDVISVAPDGSAYTVDMNSAAQGLTHGDSGGPCFDDNGNQTGVTSAFDTTINNGSAWQVSVHDVIDWIEAMWVHVPDFHSVDGRALDVGVGADGTTWVLGNDNPSGNHSIFRYDASGWHQMPGGGVAIDVGPDGKAWVVASDHSIWRWTGVTWARMPGAANDIGIGADGTVWVIGAGVASGGGYGIFRWNGSGWQQMPGAARSIDVGPKGDAYVIALDHSIYHWNGTAFDRMPGAATDIAVGGDGRPWVLGYNGLGGAQSLFDWNGVAWEQVPGLGIKLSSDEYGLPWVVAADSTIWRM